MSSSIIVSNTQGFLTSPLASLIIDGLSLLVAYGANFIACDILYHDFRIQEAIKGSYWFILGPTLYIFGPGLEWLDAWIKELVYKERQKIKGKLGGLFGGWLDKFLPSKAISKPITAIAEKTLFSDKSITVQKEELAYLHEIGRI